MNPLEMARNKKKQMIEQGLEIKQLNPREKLESNPTNKRLVINAKCFECMGEDKGYRQMIRECSSYSCPLHPVRPYQKSL